MSTTNGYRKPTDIPACFKAYPIPIPNRLPTNVDIIIEKPAMINPSITSDLNNCFSVIPIA